MRVLEQASEFGEVGAGIQLGPNVHRMFERLGIDAAVNAISAYPDVLMMRDSITGEVVTEMPAGDRFRERFSYPYAVIYRADLHRVLYDACRASDLIELHTREKVVGFEETADGVSVRTEAGATYSGNALIGADGLWSTIRRHVVGDGDARVSGHVAYRAVLPHDDMPEDLRWNAMCIWAGEKTHLVQYPLRRGELFNLVAVFHSDKFTEGWDDYGDPAELNLRFADKCEPVRTLLGKIENWRMWVLCDREPVKNWCRGRIAVLGDAAHPMLQYLAQGANMAMEDAVCLADMLVNTDGDYEKAFVRYRDARYLRTARVQLTARLYGEAYHASGVVRELRNMTLAARTPDDAYNAMAWLYEIPSSWRDADRPAP